MSVRGFNTGAGVERYDYNALDNVPLTTNTRVKGDAEVEYREGDVNLTKANIGLGNVDNTSDANKPVSTAQQTALDGKVDKVTGKGLSTNDYTNEDKQKVDDAALQSDLDDLSRQISDETTGLDTKAPAILETASGAIASFDDGADSMPIRKLVAQIEPVQDLHGYDNPWPAGGGANIWDEVWERGTIGLSTGVNVDANDKIRSKNYVPIRENTSYFFKMPFNWRMVYYDENKNVLEQGRTYSPNIVLQSPSGAHYLRFVIDGITTYGNNASINYPSTVTTYSPYSNICPISGYTGAEIEQRGKNLLPKAESKTHNGIQYVANSDGSVTVSGTATGIAILDIGRDSTILKPGTYVASISGSNAVVTLFKIVDGTVSVLKNGVGAFTLTEETSIFMRLSFASGASASGTAYPQIELGSTATAYEPYTGNQISVNWEDEAGTVYGGTLDVTNGVLTVNRAHRLLNDPDKWIEMSSGTQNFRYNYQFSERKRYADSFTGLSCSYMQVNANAQDNTARWSGVGTDYFGLRNYNLTLDQVKADAANGDIEILYDLAEPITYQLDPQEIRTLLGTNNVWADTGDIAECEYPADTKLYIQQLTKPTEDDMVANANIAANKFFMIGNALYYSTAAIAAGATIIPGTNCNAVSLADALNTLNA